jgi:hypothetical protein
MAGVFAGVFAGVIIEDTIGLVTGGAFAGTVGVSCGKAGDVLVVGVTAMVVSGGRVLAGLEPDAVPGVPMRVVRVPEAGGQGESVGGWAAKGRGWGVGSGHFIGEMDVVSKVPG